MVFKRPYGFLIKHFKLIHLIISFVLGYLVVCNMEIYSFLNNCIENYSYRYNAEEYINYGIFMLLLLAIGLFFVIYLLFKHKDKPRRLYILSIVGYLLIGVYMFILFNYLNDLSSVIIEQKVIRSYKDITMITLLFQFIIVIVMFIRGLGFNIKKFDFERDIQELNLSQEDDEEIEVDVRIDTDGIARNLRKKKRELGYYFKEYKIFVLGILLILFVIIGFNLYNNYKDLFLVYKQNEVVGINNFVAVEKSYYSVSNNKNYVIVKIDMFKNGKKEKVNINNLILKVGKEEYIPNKNICFNFSELGTCYKKQYVTNIKGSYIITYEVKDFNEKRTYLLYKESYDDSFKIKLNLENYK